ncbi:MAG: cell division protein ZipA C-terminal FtsZ-binding domain-containing protein [Pseudomonadota bacterium]
MSELHLSLTIIGAIFIAAVFFFNRWQERKYRKQTEKMFRGERQDVLFQAPQKQEKQDASSKNADEVPVKPSSGERIEPSLGATPLVAEDISVIQPHEPQLISSTVVPVTASAAVASYESAHKAILSPAPVEEDKSAKLIDEAIDLIGVMHVNKPVSADNVKNLMTRAHTFSKPVHWEAKVANQWTEVSAGRQYSDLRIAMQLADRRGPATNAEISRFVTLLKQFATELDAGIQAETEESAAARATDLDGFCADVDVEIGVNVVAGDQVMPATKLRALAEAVGLQLNSDGVFHSFDENGVSMFTLRNSEPRPLLPEQMKNITTHGITLLLDVPRVGDGVRAFDQMLQLGRHFADAFGGAVVDDNGKPLTDAGADSIRRQLGLIYREMDGYGIAAGDPLAQRLFS